MTLTRALCLSILTALMCGCEEESDESLAKRTGNTLGEAVIDFASGVGQGIDKQSLVDVELSETLIQRGFSKTTAKSLTLDFESPEGETVEPTGDETVETAEAGTDESPPGEAEKTPQGKRDDTLKKSISVYMISETPYKGKLIAKALNAEDLEIGRAVTDVDFGAEDAMYVKFRFDVEVDMQLVKRFTIDGREETSSE